MSARIIGVVLMARDVAALADFYAAALGFVRQDATGHLQLGGQSVFLHQATGADYPHARASNDPWFQHMAIVVRDIGAAHLQAVAHGAVPISRGGPQLLPASSGGVTAWKFRDPEGHPLELLEFPVDRTPAYWREAQPAGLFLGIDHTAIVVEDTARSLTFYQKIGFERAAQSHNFGPAQAALDALSEPNVLVTAMILPGHAAPHLELLEYFAPPTSRSDARWEAGAVAATRIMLKARDQGLRRDPDGHFLTFA